MSLSHNDVVKLLALVAAIDDIDVTEAKIEAWKAMAEQGRWESFEVARRALLVYRSEHPDFPVKPGHITAVLERVRAEASRRFNAENSNPPDSVTQLPHAEQDQAFARWVRDSAAATRRRVLADFAAGDQPVLRAVEAAR